MKKALSLTLAVVMVFGLLAATPLTASAKGKVIAEDPKSETFNEGESAFFYISIWEDVYNVSIQWYVNDGSGWTPVPDAEPYSGGTNMGVTIRDVPASFNGYQYRCKVSATKYEENIEEYSEIATLTVIPSAPPPDLDSASEWAKEDLAAALAKGFVPSDLLSDYRDVITRAEFCRMAVKWVEYATGKSIDAVLSEKGLSRNPNAFTDTSDPDILAAFALGITSGMGNNTFSPDGQFNREQAAGMIMNTCRAIGADVSDLPPSGFADIETASVWTIDGINFVRANGIMQGTGDDKFSPKNPYTREQSIITFSNIDYGTLPGIESADTSPDTDG